MKKINLHTHTVFCDGKNTPEEMVCGAIERGFDCLGFSVHSPMKSGAWWTIRPQDVPAYLDEIHRLQTKYAGVIEIKNGIELDREYCDVDVRDFDYVIGAVHQIVCDDRYYDVDDTPDILRDCCKKEFGGDFMALLTRYYETFSDFVCREDVQIVAHFDLVEKFNAHHELFDTDDPAYQALALRHLDRILDAKPGITFEVNTGAMFRVGNPLPYPAPFLIRALKQRGAHLIVTSDAHCVEALDFGFDKARALIDSV
ncbi:MAG: histidinol-phosphatase HisJ family protein [Clostridia bacterium]|nr:histidinol-phosphatase HisJ family protein [Clostridia bacterium]